MTATAARKSLRPFALALILIGMVFATVFDAAACEGEAMAPGTVEAVAGDADQHGSKPSPEKHAVCTHGHCHHGSNILGGPLQSELGERTAGLQSALEPDILSSPAPRLPTPPPRG